MNEKFPYGYECIDVEASNRCSGDWFLECYQIPNPRIDKKNYSILGRNGNDCEVWLWKGKNRIEKSQVKKDYYKK
jgi:hypothetical protein